MSSTTTVEKSRVKKPTLRLGAKPPVSAAQPAATPAGAVRIVPSSPRPVRLVQLLRAPENVRHVREAEDVKPLAADIAAHGLLQSLIGYERFTAGVADKVMVVGGGRRLQALQQLWEDGAIDGDFPVPVLIRDVEEAVELSLAENLQQRTMSPVDEYLAFRALMDRGDTSPARLAARFGFSERVVKQRLRLAELATPVLDALAARDITIDAALAYATTQDQQLQQEVFKVQARRGHEPHRPHAIRHAIAFKGMKTDDPTFRFVTAEVYEADGGGYEDDLFLERSADAVRVLDKPFLAEVAARRLIEAQADELVQRLQASPKFAPTIVGHLVSPDLRLRGWGNQDPIKPPPGFVEISRYDYEKGWKTIRNNGIDVHILIGIDDAGKLAAWPRRLWVPKDQQRAVDPQSAIEPARHATPEEQEALRQQREADRWARRLAVGPFAGTPFAGRAMWPTGGDYSVRSERDGVPGWYVHLTMWVTDAEIAAQGPAAKAHVEAIEAARKAAAEVTA